MKSIKILFLLVPFLCLFFALTSFAADTDLYVGASSGVKPNLMIIFDNSGSMTNSPTDSDTYCDYYPYSDFHYPQPTIAPADVAIDPVKVYTKATGATSWFPLVVYKNSVSSTNIPCAKARTALNAFDNGLFTGKPGNTACTSPSTSASYATGNWLRYFYADPGNEKHLPTKM
jgi:hypothetical protein